MVLSPVRRTITPSLKAPHHEIVSPPTRTSRIRLQLDRAPMSPMFAHVDIAFGSPPASNAKPSSKYGAPCALALIEQVVIPIVNQRGQNPRAAIATGWHEYVCIRGTSSIVGDPSSGGSHASISVSYNIFPLHSTAPPAGHQWRSVSPLRGTFIGSGATSKILRRRAPFFPRALPNPVNDLVEISGVCRFAPRGGRVAPPVRSRHPGSSI